MTSAWAGLGEIGVEGSLRGGSEAEYWQCRQLWVVQPCGEQVVDGVGGEAPGVVAELVGCHRAVLVFGHPRAQHREERWVADFGA